MHLTSEETRKISSQMKKHRHAVTVLDSRAEVPHSWLQCRM